MIVNLFKCDKCGEVIGRGIVAHKLHAIREAESIQIFDDNTHHVCVDCLFEAIDPPAVDDEETDNE